MTDTYRGRPIDPAHHMVGACGDLLTVYPTMDEHEGFIVISAHEGRETCEIVLYPHQVEELVRMLRSQYTQ